MRRPATEHDSNHPSVGAIAAGTFDPLCQAAAGVLGPVTGGLAGNAEGHQDMSLDKVLG